MTLGANALRRRRLENAAETPRPPKTRTATQNAQNAQKNIDYEVKHDGKDLSWSKPL